MHDACTMLHFFNKIKSCLFIWQFAKWLRHTYHKIVGHPAIYKATIRMYHSLTTLLPFNDFCILQSAIKRKYIVLWNLKWEKSLNYGDLLVTECPNCDFTLKLCATAISSDKAFCIQTSRRPSRSQFTYLTYMNVLSNKYRLSDHS